MIQKAITEEMLMKEYVAVGKTCMSENALRIVNSCVFMFKIWLNLPLTLLNIETRVKMVRKYSYIIP